MRNYELMVVIDSSSDAEKIDRAVAKIQEIIAEKGGKILSVDSWGRRRLAYEIQRRQYGFYVLFTFEFDPKEVKDLNRLLRLNQMVLRHLVIVLDPKMMELAAKRPRSEGDDEEAGEISGKKAEVLEDEDVDEEEQDLESEEKEEKKDNIEEQPAASEEPAPEDNDAESEKTEE